MRESYNILVVDDMKVMNIIISDYVKKSNDLISNVFEATNGQEALDVFDKENIDMIITDITMPVMDGLELIKTLRDQGNKVPIIVISAQKNNEDIVKAVSLGADRYITKPCTKEDVSNAINKFIK